MCSIIGDYRPRAYQTLLPFCSFQEVKECKEICQKIMSEEQDFLKHFSYGFDAPKIKEQILKDVFFPNEEPPRNPKIIADQIQFREKFEECADGLFMLVQYLEDEASTVFKTSDESIRNGPLCKDTARDRSLFCIFHILNKILQHPELIDTFFVRNHSYIF